MTRTAHCCAALACALAVSAGVTAEARSYSPLDLTMQAGKFSYGPSIASYWGRLDGSVEATTNKPRTGYYRARCVWFNTTDDGPDDRGVCDLVMVLGDPEAPAGKPKGGSVVAHGVATNPGPGKTLFANGSKHALAVTGGTGEYDARRGDLTVDKRPNQPPRLSVAFTDGD